MRQELEETRALVDRVAAALARLTQARLSH
jgi:hypothetical protein